MVELNDILHFEIFTLLLAAEAQMIESETLIFSVGRTAQYVNTIVPAAIKENIFFVNPFIELPPVAFVIGFSICYYIITNCAYQLYFFTFYINFYALCYILKQLISRRKQIHSEGFDKQDILR